MSDTNNSDPFAASGSGKSPEEIAFELVSKLKGQGVWGERNQSAILDMYAECLDAVKGLRAYEGQNRVMAPIRQVAAPQGQSSAQTQAPSQSPILPQPQAQAQIQPQAMPSSVSPQSVQAQQIQVQQAFKQG